LRILICDYHVIVAEALASVLTGRGDDVIATTHDIDTAADVLRTADVDVCLLSLVFRGERHLHRIVDVRRAAPRTRLLLLVSRVDAAVLAAARDAGAAAIADQRQSMRRTIELIDRLGRGAASAGGVLVAAEPTGGSARTDVRRLATFLTVREREALGVLVIGGDTRTVARSLGIAPATARCHIQSLLTKMGAHTRLEAATTAVRAGIVSPDTGDWLLPTI